MNLIKVLYKDKQAVGKHWNYHISIWEKALTSEFFSSARKQWFIRILGIRSTNPAMELGFSPNFHSPRFLRH